MSKFKLSSFSLLLTLCFSLSLDINTSFSQFISPSKAVTKLDLSTSLLKSEEGINSLDQAPVRRKSPGLAAFMSLAVPGLGELYAGRYDVGKYSTIAEVSLWVFYTAVEVYSDQVRSDAINYARIYAGAQVEGKSDQFFVDLGNFLNTNDYNIQKIHNGENNLIYSASLYQWQWQSDADRAKFKSLRIKADEFLNYGRYAAAVIIFNHIVSAFDAARLAVGVNASAATSLDNSPRTEGIYLKLAASF
ncbi:MAG TPA: hypothetical protein VLX91_15940 [Candidatus Acidoferrales bacterium]|nr:hypothetical protein [Candidatus Acidoferrales bacterium]